MNMNLQRIFQHATMTRARLRRAFPPSSLEAIERAIHTAESSHAGEIRLVVEGSLDGMALLRGQTAKSRALELFSQLAVWDTAHNNGMLIYLLLADRAVEIVADRGIHAKVGAQPWSEVCRQMEQSFAQSQFEHGVVQGIQTIAGHMAKHFPPSARGRNELPDAPVLL